MKVNPKLWICKEYGYVNGELKCTLYNRYCLRACPDYQEDAGTDYEVYEERDDEQRR